MILLIEPVINNIKSYLETNLGTTLDLLDAHYDDFALDDIQAYYVAELQAVPAMPSMFILGEDTTVLAEGPGHADSDHRITIACIAADADSEILRRKLYRYMDALLVCLRGTRLEHGWVLNFESIIYSPLYTAEGGYLADARLTLSVSQVESI